MTQEQKARAYDEALEKAREIKDKIMYSHLSTESCKAVSEYIDTIIPELAESEDERIRKWLIELVESQMPKTFIEVKKLDVFAWLEKQKEQKPAEWSEEDKDNLCRVIRVLEDNDSDWKELSNWLKSLSPSWKPSEEQEEPEYYQHFDPDC